MSFLAITLLLKRNLPVEMRPCRLASSKYNSKTSPGKDKRSRSKAAVLLGTYLVREGLTYALKVLTHAGVVDLTDNCCKD